MAATVPIPIIITMILLGLLILGFVIFGFNRPSIGMLELELSEPMCSSCQNRNPL